MTPQNERDREEMAVAKIGQWLRNGDWTNCSSDQLAVRIYNRESALREKINRYETVLKRIAKPALGGKQQQWDAQAALDLEKSLGREK